MPQMQPKPVAGNRWLPSQVAYGIDCSDPDPSQWKAFGYLHDQQEEASNAARKLPASKPNS